MFHSNPTNPINPITPITESIEADRINWPQWGHREFKPGCPVFPLETGYYWIMPREDAIAYGGKFVIAYYEPYAGMADDGITKLMGIRPFKVGSIKDLEPKIPKYMDFGIAELSHVGPYIGPQLRHYDLMPENFGLLPKPTVPQLAGEPKESTFKPKPKKTKPPYTYGFSKFDKFFIMAILVIYILNIPDAIQNKIEYLKITSGFWLYVNHFLGFFLAFWIGILLKTLWSLPTGELLSLTDFREAECGPPLEARVDAAIEELQGEFGSSAAMDMGISDTAVPKMREILLKNLRLN